jgi:hypothetical protein
MLLNFQKQFALPVWSGAKRQTIRSQGKRKDLPKVNEWAYCYTGLRTVSTQKLGQFPIETVRDLRMTVGTNGISNLLLGGDRVNAAELDMLAQADGFVDGAAMAQWFARNHPAGEFCGWVVRWAYNPHDVVARPVGCDV